MSSTVLTFMDFFWIWFIAAVLNGRTTYLQKDGTVDKDALDTVRDEMAALTEEIRRLKGDSGRAS